MALLQFISDHIAISLVLLVLLIALAVFLAQKFSAPIASTGVPSSDAEPFSLQSTTAETESDQSPAAKAFREKLKTISLDLDKD